MNSEITQQHDICRIQQSRDWMKKNELDALLVFSTDNYLNESVSLAENQCAYLSLFTGTVGNLLILHNKALLFVDGRYHLQAESQVDQNVVEVVKLSFHCTSLQGIQSVLVQEFKEFSGVGGFKVALNQHHISYLAMKTLRDKKYHRTQSVEFIHMPYPLGQCESLSNSKLEKVSSLICDRTFESKFNETKLWLDKKHLDFVLVTQLDELAYLLNVRFFNKTFRSTFKGFSLIGRQVSFLFLDNSLYNNLDVRKQLHHVVGEQMQIVSESNGFDILLKKICQLSFASTDKSVRPYSIGFDFSKMSYGRYHQFYHLESLHRVCCWKFVCVETPLFHMKKIKTKGEVDHMRDACHRSDRVFVKTITWLREKKKMGYSVSEKQFADCLTQEFFNEGARDLSFLPIVASGKNSAMIHYSHPSDMKMIDYGELLLVDAGAYFEGGYATDMTRTYLIHSSKKDENKDEKTQSSKQLSRQRRMYSLVLSAALKPMRASFPKGTKGVHLDTMARCVIWEHGYQFLHSVGHGVGIMVHEMPPSIGPGSMDVIEENMIFSIEPGLYIKDFGGVRIETLVIACAHPSITDWLCLRPLNQCPLDENLIDINYFSRADLEYLQSYGYISAGWISSDNNNKIQAG